MSRCRTCGTDMGDGMPTPDRCGSCPPTTCPDCHQTTSGPCACYTSLDGLPLADIKALLARGDLSVGTPGDPA